jgi:hypothetical protein
MSGSALKAFCRLVLRWSLRDDDAKQLLGGHQRFLLPDKKHPDRRVLLDPHTFQRVSYLCGILKALNVLHSQPLADGWISLPNSNRIFGGGTLLSYMIRGLPAMGDVHRS